MNIMRQCHVTTLVQSQLKVVLSVPDHIWACILVVLGVKVRADYFVAEVGEKIHTKAVAGEVRSAHVGGHETKNIDEGVLSICDLGRHIIPRKGR